MSIDSSAPRNLHGYGGKNPGIQSPAVEGHPYIIFGGERYIPQEFQMDWDETMHALREATVLRDEAEADYSSLVNTLLAAQAGALKLSFEQVRDLKVDIAQSSRVLSDAVKRYQMVLRYHGELVRRIERRNP